MTKQTEDSELSAEARQHLESFEASSNRRMADGNAANEPTAPLYHYTSEAALYSIVSSATFRFSSIYTMDDKIELQFGWGISQSILKAFSEAGDQWQRAFCQELGSDEDLEKIKKLFEFYSVSFSVRDDRKQWEQYGDKNRGVAFGLAPKFFQPAPFADPANPKPEEHIFFGKVVYGEDAARPHHTAVIKEAVESLKKAIDSGSIHNEAQAQRFFQEMAAQMSVEILWNCVTTKDDSWRHQNETRLLSLNNLKAPKLEIQNKDVRPRVDLPQPLLKECLVEVQVGPDADAGMEARIKEFLAENDLSNIPVTRSPSSPPY